MNTDSLSFNQRQEIEAEQQRFMTKVFGWMSFALAVTGLVAYFTASSVMMIDFIFGSKLTFYGLLGAELLLVWVISASINSLSAKTATFLFLLYSILNGVTLSAIFLVFTSASITSTFLITAGTFSAMALYGYTTKNDLTSIGNLLLMALIGLIIASVVNFFLNSEMLYWITTYVGVIIFVGLTAYDTQKIKEMNIIGNEGTEEDTKEALLGALTLYLDFINLFLYLLRLFGKRK